MYSRLALPIALIALFLAASAHAECVFPAPPDSIPDGATATYEEMVEAHKAVRAFDEDVRTFTVCFELEVKTLLADPSIDEPTKNDLRELLVLRNNTAIEEVEFVVASFNEQLRMFRERDAQ